MRVVLLSFGHVAKHRAFLLHPLITRALSLSSLVVLKVMGKLFALELPMRVFFCIERARKIRRHAFHFNSLGEVPSDTITIRRNAAA